MVSFIGSFNTCYVFIKSMPKLAVAGRQVAELCRLPDEVLARRGLVRGELVQRVYSKHGLIGSESRRARIPQARNLKVQT